MILFSISRFNHFRHYFVFPLEPVENNTHCIEKTKLAQFFFFSPDQISVQESLYSAQNVLSVGLTQTHRDKEINLGFRYIALLWKNVNWRWKSLRRVLSLLESL